MNDKKFSKQHEWISIEGEVATIGITKHAAEMLGDIVFVELPEKGKNVEKEGQAGVVESTKAASDIYTPITGEIVETNQSIVDDPAEINKNPEGTAWLFKIKIKNKSELDELMNRADYEKFVKENPS
ncbi:MAG: glycine cleavage system protein GcvH [Pelagibacteraceae bacterium]|jgi:glycine cleavage system H protein|nr:glycine cleavage system protein H [Candidatus Pelagibacter sp.]MDP6680455.1 glycine cleavage system protein GcvH [Pelagibacteraceae bacterium]MDP6710031.1 glycine cleavage system protein GcvH [Pelagibacteraceae bacterium]|tara:strand:- start:763 stop:1143 length:381 start_codon:yes stop_codon:yes gene_type:complete